MEARSWFRMLATPEGAWLGALLGFAAARRAKYPTFLLVQRASSTAADELLASLADKSVTSAVTDRWPGLSAEGPAQVHFYRLDGDAARALTRADPRAADLCILRNDKSPWLVSARLRPDGASFFLQLSGEEQRELAKGLPWLGLAESAPPPNL